MASSTDKQFLSTAFFLLVAISASSSAVSQPDSLAGRLARRDRLPDIQYPPPRPVPRRPTPYREPSRCSCDEGRMTQIDEQIASLLEKTNELTRQSAESRNNIASMMSTNRQLRSQMSHVMREKRSLEADIRTLQTRASSLTQANERLRAENERRMTAPLQDSVDARENPAPVRPPLRELDDVVGNREAEMVEMGLPVPVGRPESRQRPSTAHQWASDSRSDLDAENVASSLLAVNMEIKDMMRKVEQLERREQSQFREVPPYQGESDQVSEKITQLERLVLVALGSRPGSGAGELVIAGDTAPLMRPHPGAAARERPPSAERLAIADTMSEEDLNAMADVVESVQNRSPRKCAFSVASTGVTLGTDRNPTTIQFDHEFVNKGGDFKMRQNRFVCEHAGFYFITFTVRSYDGKYLGVTLMKNDDVQTAIYADLSDRNVMQSQSMVVHLKSGDRLWLRIAASDNFAVHSGPHRYVTFSGFMVYRGF